jgi:serine/threonine protein kinase
VTAPRLNAGGIIAGKYTVRSILGNSGAVITYQCANPQGQEVAVKLYDPAVASHATVMKSLEQAYAATNALPQNSAAPIVDAGYDQPTLAPFSVTEMLRLPSLQSLQRRLPPEEVVALLKGLARSLDLAHVRNVVHGAIKPTNVFVGPACNPTIVTDFAANLPKAAVPTQEGFVQSAPWIAPEQAQSGSVTPAADVFSVGLLVFFALTGRTYWRSTQGQTFDLNGWQQELGAPRGPASQRAMELGVALSPTLDIVLWKALSNDPQERLQEHRRVRERDRRHDDEAGRQRRDDGAADGRRRSVPRRRCRRTCRTPSEPPPSTVRQGRRAPRPWPFRRRRSRLHPTCPPKP